MLKAFVIMPFNDAISNSLYELSTKPICEEFDLKVQRADEIFTTNPVLDDILSAIEEASVVIADISGKNPNVFYELGIAHMLKRKQTIMITHEEFEGIPFDISHFRIIKYEDTISGKTKYEAQLRKTLKNILRDYMLIYKNEFELIFKIFVSGNQQGKLYDLIALAKIPKPMKKDGSIDLEGHSERGRISSKGGTVEYSLNVFIEMEFVQIAGDFIILTDKGKAFVKFLEERGFVVDFVNGQILTPGFVPTMQKHKDKKSREKKKQK